MGVLLVLQFAAKTYESDTHVVIIQWAFSDAGSTPAASTTLRLFEASGGEPRCWFSLGFLGWAFRDFLGWLLGILALCWGPCITFTSCGVLRIRVNGMLGLRMICAPD